MEKQDEKSTFTGYLHLCINLLSIENLDEGLENAKYYGILKFFMSSKFN